MQRIEIPNLTIGGEVIPSPVGLSEILESSWSLNVNRENVNQIADKYDFKDYKNPEGNWATKCSKKKGECLNE